ncbi:hypothetical protein DCC85_11055 [Paenibacillus sp. CAA11]|uniref:S-layer homology domain-containing protein n=1 Tax=Paenibacillus sp. CAA11 TaxID=1532905 RepID=UPI000D35D371|nr:S-layer homology domain-containing protein [Paenibacillus sp. CAA11]AWB44703.1 hypothetical protein DCC85_11055 [Paenibacillus sp. CAA11]
MSRQKRLKNKRKSMQRLHTSLLAGTLLAGSIPGLVHAAGDNTAASSAAASSKFTDLSKTPKSKQDAIQEAAGLGFVTGDSTGQFRPSEILTRQELAVLLTRVMKLPVSSQQRSSFKDVSASSWSASAIEAVSKAGIMTGNGTGGFRPGKPVSREELAAIFVRAVNGVGAQGGSEVQVQDRSKVSGWASDAVDTALRLQLIDTPDDKLNPLDSVKREDIASFLLDIFHSGEQTSTISKVDGDIIEVDGKPYLVDGKLKELLGQSNADALEGAILRYKSANRNINDLSELEIVKSAVVFDAKDTVLEGTLKISANGVTVKGASLSQLTLGQGVSNVNVDAKVNTLVVDGGQEIQLKGNALVDTLKVTNPGAKLNLDSHVEIAKVQLPTDLKWSQVFANWQQLDGQIQRVQGGIDDRPKPSSTSNSTSSSASSSYPSSPSSPSPVTPPVQKNHAPTVQNNMDSVTAEVTDGIQTVSLKNVFADADNDTLNFKANSSNEGIATVSVDGENLKITPVNAGTTTITVTADDGNGGTMDTDFTATFTAPQLPPQQPINHSPSVANPINDVSADVTDGPQHINLSNVFSDEDNDSLTYTAISSDVATAEVSITDSQLTVTPLKAGQVTITVTADDGNGGTMATDFTVTFTASQQPINHSPSVANPINDVSADVTDGPQHINLSNVFSDEDNDSLTYTAVSSDVATAEVSITDSQLTVTPLKAGQVTITVTADDGNGGTVDTDFTVTFTAADPTLPPSVGQPSPFISEMVWGSNYSMAVELYNPTDEPIYNVIVRIEDYDIYVNDPIPAHGTLVLYEISGQMTDTDSYSPTSFDSFIDSTSPVALSLYINNDIDHVVDQATYTPGQTLRRNVSTIKGSEAFDSSQWGQPLPGDTFDGLGSFD